jgi:hypothetical protein
MTINLTPEDPTCERFFLFDGLRGEKEIYYAAKALPHALFALLDTPDIVRIKRILDRKDPYDRFFPERSDQDSDDERLRVRSFAEIGEPDASEIFSGGEERELLDMVNNGLISMEELQDKLRLILVERSLYDMRETVAALKESAADRTLFIDTTKYKPAQIADQVVSHLRAAGML